MATETLALYTADYTGENPFADRGIRYELHTRHYKHNGHLYTDVSVVAFDGLEKVGHASHPACLHPQVREYLKR